MFRSRSEGIDLVCQVARSGPDNVVPVYRRVKYFGRSVAGQVVRRKERDDGNRFLPSLFSIHRCYRKAVDLEPAKPGASDSLPPENNRIRASFLFPTSFSIFSFL